MFPIYSSDHLIDRAIDIAQENRKRRVAVAAAQDVDVIDAVSQANSDGFIDGVLVGNEAKIKSLANDNLINITQLEIINETDPIQAAHTAVKLASDGNVDALMKGFLPTSALLKVVLDKQYNLRGKNTLSHCAVLDIPGYHKLLNLTDGGMVVKPDQGQKFQILENAVMIGYALGLSPVKIAVSSAFDNPKEKVPHSLSDMDYLIPKVMANLKDVVIQGSIPFDMATDKNAARLAGCAGPVCGEADIFVVDSIEECNIIAKSLIQFAQAVFAGVIVGAKVPVSLVSRSDTVKNKKTSLALAAVVSDYYEKTGVMKRGEQ